MTRPIRFCSVPDCGRRVHGHGLCTKHYARLRLYGTIYLGDEAHAKQIAQLPGQRTWHEWLSWAAGFIDGDGSIWIMENNGYLQMGLSAWQVKREPLDVLNILFGGHIREKRRINSKYASTFECKMTGAKAAEVLKQLEPFMVAKRQQVTLAIEFNRHRGAAVTSEEHQRRLSLRNAIRSLNTRS